MTFKKIAIRLSIGLFLGATALAYAGCGPGASCRKICTRYADCYDKDFNVDDCARSCVEESREKRQYAEQVDVCRVCIRDRSCRASFGRCDDECDRIIP